MVGPFEPPEGLPGWVVTVIAGTLTAIAGWWKGRGIVRRDKRADREEEVVSGGYEEIVKQQREQNAALVTDFGILRAELATMRQERDSHEARADDAERDLRRLRAHSDLLEQQVKVLQGRG